MKTFWEEDEVLGSAASHCHYDDNLKSYITEHALDQWSPTFATWQPSGGWGEGEGTRLHEVGDPCFRELQIYQIYLNVFKYMLGLKFKPSI